ncbi:MYG1 family protein [Thiomicrorhabdus sp. ZW0627]|uniref:MYG1 family protein n=1 Tax=Thiomicrorhabdus sp. ZW0627 TaxID=3039774 RepID=UPI00243637FB|nr:MYG1 family protein [Thiomicrorhabdus sp. ZW0627]MDG6774665.1 MYG1 family protein [Thiomicrorhabdus sp. ZW0627]
MLVTHSGRFHADEVFAISMILMLGEQEIVRSRDQEIIDQAEIVLDVGAEYDPETLRFDHHQNSFTRTREDGTPYATAGLVWEHFGKEILAKKGLEGDYEQQFALEWVDQKIIKDIDAVDNGMFVDDPRPSVSMLIGMMNVSSTDEVELQDAAFKQAIELTTNIMENFISAAIKEAEVVQELEACAENIDEGILVLEENLPFKDFIRSRPDITRVVYPKGPEGYGVFCNGHENHLPERFRGLREEELKVVTGLDDAVFCHKSGFMSVCRSFESALTMAKSH